MTGWPLALVFKNPADIPDWGKWDKRPDGDFSAPVVNISTDLYEKVRFDILDSEGTMGVVKYCKERHKLVITPLPVQVVNVVGVVGVNPQPDPGKILPANFKGLKQ